MIHDDDESWQRLADRLDRERDADRKRAHERARPGRPLQGLALWGALACFIAGTTVLVYCLIAGWL